MAYTPFAESDRPSRENFNAKFADAIAEAKSQALSAGVRIVTGSYVGDGTYGEENPTHLEFEDIQPMLVAIYGYFGSPAIRGLGTGLFVNFGTSEYLKGYADYGSSIGSCQMNYRFYGHALDIYSNSRYTGDEVSYQGAQQGNMAGETYYYIAIGQGVEA